MTDLGTVRAAAQNLAEAQRRAAVAELEFRILSQAALDDGEHAPEVAAASTPRTCQRVKTTDERADTLRSFHNLAVAQELEAIAETNPDVRRGMVAVIDIIRAVVEVEKR